MSNIEELRERVELAERRFGLIDEQERRYSERLISLMDALETGRSEQLARVETSQARIGELERENGELRGMLHALLLGVEAGGRDMLAGTLRDLDSRLSGMLGTAPSISPPAEEAAPALDTVDIAAADEQAIAVAEEEVPADPAEPGANAAEAGSDEPDDALPDEVAAVEDVADETPDASNGAIAGEADTVDPVTAAEKAVAALIGTGPEGGAPEEVDGELEVAAGADEPVAVDDLAAGDDTVFEETAGAEPAEEPGIEIEAGADEEAGSSPVGAIIERLAADAEDLASEAAIDDSAPEQHAEPQSEPAAAHRKKA